MRGTWRLLPLILTLFLGWTATAVAGQHSYGLSAFGELKYPADFTHFDYVDPNAPKGGTLSMIGTAGITTFNSFNNFILKGDAAQGLDLLFDTLMEASADEPDSLYGLVAKSAERSDDKKSVTFYLRPEARFADGSKVTAADVAFSFNILKTKGHPSYRLQLRDVVGVDVIDDYTIRYRFQGELVRDLPRLVASLPILSAKYYSTREFDKTTLEPPLGSGPYKIANYDQGRQVTYQRRPDYWAADLPVNKGRYNFDKLSYEYYRDRVAEFEGLIGGQYDLREEFTSREWATRYDLPQFKDGRMIRELLPDKSPSGAQGFFLNTRREKFSDPRVRRAFDLAFDFEWTNKNMFYNSYIRTESFFENSDLKATGLPTPTELALLEPYKDELPKEVFGLPYSPAKTDGSGTDRRNLRKAQRLLKEAGWTVRLESAAMSEACGFLCRAAIFFGFEKDDSKAILRNQAGEPLDVEFLIYDTTFERIIAPYIHNLEILGIRANIRRVDNSQYERRMKDFDFDITSRRYVLGLTPGIAMRNFWSSQSADLSGSANLSGIKSKAVDALIEKMIGAHSRNELRTAAHALDRVLRAGHYWVPQWYYPFHRMAYWNKFSRPPHKPPYSRAIIDTWWVDKAKEAKLKKN